MDAALISNWNTVVKPGDKVFHLGDFCFKGNNTWEHYRNQLNGNITLIKGNHDKIQDGQVAHLFDGVYDYLELKVNDKDARDDTQLIVLCHYAFRVWNKSHHGAWHLYGHSHGTLPDDPNSQSFDCGVDCHNYKPLSYQEVKNIMKTKSFTPIDHHGETK
jgi:calcineurin-like phosphoesterase family protein